MWWNTAQHRVHKALQGFFQFPSLNSPPPQNHNSFAKVDPDSQPSLLHYKTIFCHISDYLRVQQISPSPVHIQEPGEPALSESTEFMDTHIWALSLTSTIWWEKKSTRGYWPCLLLWGVRLLRLCSSSWWVRVGLAPAIRRTVASCRKT